MDTIFFTLACWLLAFSFAVAPTEKPTSQGLTDTNAITDITSTTSSVSVTVITTPTKDSSTLTSTSDSHTFTENTSTTAGTTGHLQTFQSTTTQTSITNSSSVTETPGTQTPPSTVLTTPTAFTTTDYVSSSHTTVITTADSTVNKTSQSAHTTTHGLGLNTAERNLTIVFCCILGVCAVVLVLFMLHRCKHKLQYVHQPLNNTNSTGDAFTTDDDTLVISGGLYDGHPIYDNVPTPRTDESQFRLEFLH